MGERILTVKNKIASINKGNAEQPSYQGSLPKGNDGLGLMLLGVTGDQVLPKEVYEKIKAENLLKIHQRLVRMRKSIIK